MPIMQMLVSNAAAEKLPVTSAVRRNTGAPKLPKAKRGRKRILKEESLEDLTKCLLEVGSARSVAAFETLFTHYGPRIRAFMIKRGADKQLAEELMQETMMQIWNKAALFDPARGSVSSWMFTVARNVRIDAYRKSRRPEFDPNDPAFVPEDVQPADRQLETRDNASRLRSALLKLPPEQSKLLELSFFEEISHSSIAERMNLPLGTVKSRIRLAFSRLRDALGEI